MTDFRLQVAGDTPEERFRALFARHYPAVFRYAGRRLGREEAADAAAEAFTVAWRKIAHVPPEPETLPWLYGVARRVVANAERGRRRRERLAARAAGDAAEAARRSRPGRGAQRPGRPAPRRPRGAAPRRLGRPRPAGDGPGPGVLPQRGGHPTAPRPPPPGRSHGRHGRRAMSRDPFEHLRESNPMPDDHPVYPPMSTADRIAGGAPRRPWPAWALAGAVALAVLVGGGGWLLWAPRRHSGRRRHQHAPRPPRPPPRPPPPSCPASPRTTPWSTSSWRTTAPRSCPGPT